MPFLTIPLQSKPTDGSFGPLVNIDINALIFTGAVIGVSALIVPLLNKHTTPYEDAEYSKYYILKSKKLLYLHLLVYFKIFPIIYFTVKVQLGL